MVGSNVTAIVLVGYAALFVPVVLWYLPGGFPGGRA